MFFSDYFQKYRPALFCLSLCPTSSFISVFGSVEILLQILYLMNHLAASTVSLLIIKGQPFGFSSCYVYLPCSKPAIQWIEAILVSLLIINDKPAKTSQTKNQKCASVNFRTHCLPFVRSQLSSAATVWVVSQ